MPSPQPSPAKSIVILAKLLARERGLIEVKFNIRQRNRAVIMSVPRRRCLVVSNRERHGCRDRAPRDGLTACLTQRQRCRGTVKHNSYLNTDFSIPSPQPSPAKSIVILTKLLARERGLIEGGFKIQQ